MTVTSTIKPKKTQGSRRAERAAGARSGRADKSLPGTRMTWRIRLRRDKSLIIMVLSSEISAVISLPSCQDL